MKGPEESCPCWRGSRGGHKDAQRAAAPPLQRQAEGAGLVQLTTVVVTHEDHQVSSALHRAICRSDHRTTGPVVVQFQPLPWGAGTVGHYLICATADKVLELFKTRASPEEPSPSSMAFSVHYRRCFCVAGRCWTSVNLGTMGSRLAVQAAAVNGDRLPHAFYTFPSLKG